VNRVVVWRLAAAGALPVAVLILLLGVVVLSSSDQQRPDLGGCGPAGSLAVDPATVPAGPVAGYGGAQLVNAALIVNAGQTLGLSVRGQTIGVMTAMGESSLTAIDYGDAAGPDSRGLFQQRANGAWGSYADRMDPTTSATNFFRALMAVPGWETLPPTIAAHRTQRNANPDHYTRYWDPAIAVVNALAGAQVLPAGLAGTGALACQAQPASSLDLPPGSWTKPAIGPETSGFGMRWGRMHNGLDIAPPCGQPIYAAAAGTVVRAGPSSGYGNLIVIDHGGGVLTRYAHMYPPDVLVAVGVQVPAGAQIARVGSFGDSTGCHLHFEVLLDGAFTDPAPFMTSRGVPL
jgi:hypothetical protein